MNILFIADPLDGFKIHKDSTFAMMRECQRRGLRVSVAEVDALSWRRGEVVSATCRELRLTGQPEAWYEVLGESRQPPPISLPLLIAAAVVALLEALMARWFSHATVEKGAEGATA